MTEKKIYQAQCGFPLDANFLTHVANCSQCRRFDAKKPGTISMLCLEGSVLWKAENHQPALGKSKWKPDTWRSKAEVKAAMKYKGDVGP